MTPTIIRFECEPYLIQFMEKKFGKKPIRFPRKHDFNNLLEYLLDMPPLDYSPVLGENTLSIILPDFRTIHTSIYSYLSPASEVIFKKRMKLFFRITFHADINQAVVCGIQKKDAIGLFMEKYDLSPDCIDMLEKDYNRYLTLRRVNRRNRKKINSVN